MSKNKEEKKATERKVSATADSGVNPLDILWTEKADYVRKYYSYQGRYKRLCHEIEHILNHLLSCNNIKLSQITSRVKTLDSFAEKIIRKTYDDPFRDISDFSGVRVVYLYISDKKEIENLIEKEFDIVERVDKLENENIDQFGYGALHYIVKLKDDYNQAHYNDLKDLVCEVQVRTILQDAWAMVAHHLSYKQNSSIPKTLQRKLNALSGLFETADDQFEKIKTARETYQDEFKGALKNENRELLDKTINLDNLTAYLEWKFPKRDVETEKSISSLLSDINRLNYKNILAIDKEVGRANDALLAYEKKYPPYDYKTDSDVDFSRVGAVRVSLYFTNVKYGKESGEALIEERKEFIHLLKSK